MSHKPIPIVLLVTIASTLCACGADAPIPVDGEQRLQADPAEACPAAFVAMAPAPGENQGFRSAEQERSFYFAAPDPATYPGPRPLLVGFHGSGEGVGITGAQFFERAALSVFVDAGFIVVNPDANQNGRVWPFWDDIRAADDRLGPNPDLTLFDDLVQCTAAHYPVDATRIFVAGTSAGGSMANVVLQNRVDLIAGGVVSSGIFDLTTPDEPMPLDDLTVVVMWSGDEDISFPGGNRVNWAEQSSQASRFYAEAAGVDHVRCSADPSKPHGWLPELSPWLSATLLERPKGASGEIDVDAVMSPYHCSPEPFLYEGTTSVSCPPSTVQHDCQGVCDFIGDCGVENATVGPIISDQLMMFGFGGEENTDCGGCITRCEAQAQGSADAEVLACLAESDERELCGAGIEGFMPLANAFNDCCEGRVDSTFCIDACQILLTNRFGPSFFSTCESLAPTE